MICKEGFKEVYNAHFDAVRRYVFYRCGDTELASDIAQDVFVKIWENRDSLDISTIKPLLYRMATSYCINEYRRQLCRMNFEQSMKQVHDSESSAEDEISFNELRAAYERILEQMPDKQRTIYLMSRENGMKYTEIAERLQVSVKTVEKYISASLRLFKTKLIT